MLQNEEASLHWPTLLSGDPLSYQHYCLETHCPTNITVWRPTVLTTLTASVLGLVKRVQANATTANSSLSSFRFDSCACTNQHDVCFELLWSIASSLPIDYNSMKVKAIFLPNQWDEMHLFHFLLNKCLDKPKLVTICNFNHLLFNYFLGLFS